MVVEVACLSFSSALVFHLGVLNASQTSDFARVYLTSNRIVKSCVHPLSLAQTTLKLRMRDCMGDFIHVFTPHGGEYGGTQVIFSCAQYFVHTYTTLLG